MGKQLKWEGKSIFQKSFLFQNLSSIIRLIAYTFTSKKQVSTFSFKQEKLNKKYETGWGDRALKPWKKAEFQNRASAYVLSCFCNITEKVQ